MVALRRNQWSLCVGISTRVLRADHSFGVASVAGQEVVRIAAGLARLGERLDRVEHQLANVSATKTAPSTAQQNTSSARPAVPVQRLAPGAAAKISLGPPSTESNADRRQNAIEGWTIQGIYSGTAVLAGPDGIRRVSPGDTVPGVGRVDSIVRRGSRWVVITSGGMITAD